MLPLLFALLAPAAAECTDTEMTVTTEVVGVSADGRRWAVRRVGYALDESCVGFCGYPKIPSPAATSVTDRALADRAPAMVTLHLCEGPRLHGDHDPGLQVEREVAGDLPAVLQLIAAREERLATAGEARIGRGLFEAGAADHRLLHAGPERYPRGL
ncbi:MAG: hypothetical protein JRJ84_26065 [Deltaproteobacteria bacterium]|nr:hypothetical protein [Deltaproteobacteria bacterium]